MIQRNDIVKVKATGEMGRVAGAGSELQVIVTFRDASISTKRFTDSELELIQKADSTI